MKFIKKLPVIKTRRPDTHKGDYGKVLVIAGSRGMTGAAYLTAQSSLRSGAGLVYLAAPFSQQPILAVKLTCAITYSLEETEQGAISTKAIKQIISLLDQNKKNNILTFAGIDAIGIGPGLSRNPETVKFVHSVLPLFKCPAVIDADGINALAEKPEIMNRVNGAILTPHSGEMARLLKITPTKIKFNRVDSAVNAAKRFNSIVVLKGHQTVVTDGENVYINATGNPGMATAGSGDVLTGMVTAFLAQTRLTAGQEFSPFEAAQLGVYLHGLAGDIAVKRIGETSLIATDILDAIPEAILKFKSQRR